MIGRRVVHRWTSLHLSLLCLRFARQGYRYSCLFDRRLLLAWPGVPCQRICRSSRGFSIADRGDPPIHGLGMTPALSEGQRLEMAGLDGPVAGHAWSLPSCPTLHGVEVCLRELSRSVAER